LSAPAKLSLAKPVVLAPPKAAPPLHVLQQAQPLGRGPEEALQKTLFIMFYFICYLLLLIQLHVFFE